MRGGRKCGTCAFSSLEKVQRESKKKGDDTHYYQLFCRHSCVVYKVERDGWCYQWELKHD